MGDDVCIKCEEQVCVCGQMAAVAPAAAMAESVDHPGQFSPISVPRYCFEFNLYDNATKSQLVDEGFNHSTIRTAIYKLEELAAYLRKLATDPKYF